MSKFPPFPEKIMNVEKTDLGIFYIYSKYAIGVIHEGINLTNLQQLSILVAVCEKHFGLQEFVYISYRLNSYSIDPTLYSYLLEMKNLAGIGIVTRNELYKQNFKVEKVFYSKNMRIFDKLEEAIKWSHDIID